MSLLSDAKAATKTSKTVESTPKKSNSDYQKRARERAYKAATSLRTFLMENKVELPQELKEGLAFLCKDKGSGNLGGKPALYKIFGNNPKIGDSITSLKVFEDTGKGFSEMRQLMKKWDKQGIVVDYDESTKSYVIKSGDISPFIGE